MKNASAYIKSIEDRKVFNSAKVYTHDELIEELKKTESGDAMSEWIPVTRRMPEEEPEHKSFRQRYAERKEQNVRLAENPSEDVW